MDTSERIRKAREAAGISQAQLARMVGVSPSTPYRWEAGRSRPQTEAVKERLSRVLGVSLIDLFPRDEPDSTHTAETENRAAA